MSTLRIFDVSQYISAGAPSDFLTMGVIEGPTAYIPRRMSCGGVNFIMNAVYLFSKEMDTDLVFCFDRPATIKRELHEKLFPHMNGYKGNRPGKPRDIGLQRQLAEEILIQVGLNVVYADNYEADDCIATIVRDYADSYDKVCIHTRDSDLSYLVRDNVNVVPLTDKGKTVTLSNWEVMVKTGYTVPYNTLTLNKLLTGEMGDNIPAIPYRYNDIILNHIPKEQFNKCGNNDLLRAWVTAATDNDPIVAGTLDLITPTLLPEYSIELYEADFDRKLFDYYAVTLGNWYYKNAIATECSIGGETLDNILDQYYGR